MKTFYGKITDDKITAEYYIEASTQEEADRKIKEITGENLKMHEM